MEQYELQLQEFQGPLEKLLELIESKEMEITRLSLASVTADFIAYIKDIEKVHPRILADFIAIAAKLILIKSHALLPSMQLEEEEEKEIVDLERRLHLYQRFKEAEKNVTLQWGKNVAFQRPYLAAVEKGFYMTESLTVDDLKKALQGIIAELSITFPRYEKSEVAMVNLQEKITELLARVDRTVQTSFNEITKGRHRVEVIVLFLALLHLMRNQSIESAQNGLFSDIVIKKHI